MAAAGEMAIGKVPGGEANRMAAGKAAIHDGGFGDGSWEGGRAARQLEWRRLGR